jgi:flagellin-like protein
MKILKSKKALSPVVASIILIAVTVAVSIAVAAWMGALSVGFMTTEQLTIVDVRLSNSTTKQVYIEVSNTGGGTVTITDIRIDEVTYKNFGGSNNGQLDINLPLDLSKGNSTTFTITFTSWPFQSGVKYYFKVFTAKGNSFGPYEKTAPSP